MYSWAVIWASVRPSATSLTSSRSRALSALATTLAERKVDQVRMNPAHARYVVDNAWLDGDPAQVIDAIRPLFVDLRCEEAFSIWFSMAPLRALPDMALSLQTEAYIRLPDRCERRQH